MEITKLSTQVKNPNRINVFVNGKYEFSFDLDQVIEHKIKVRQPISDQQLLFFKQQSLEGKIKAQAIDWLFRRPHSEAELRNYLKKKQLDEPAIDSLVGLMQSKDYQNDQKFAQWWVEQRLASNKSRRFIAFELRAKGVNTEIIEQVIDDTGLDELRQIEQLVVKKRLTTKYPEPQKLIAYLLRQGFSYDKIKDFMNRS